MTVMTAPAPPHPAEDQCLEVGPGIRGQVQTLGQLAQEVLATAGDHTRGSRGTVAALVDLLDVIDTAQAAAASLISRIEADGRSEHEAGLPLEALLAFRSRLTGGDRRTLIRVAEVLEGMPVLRAAWHDGVVGFATVRAIVAEAQRLNRAQRAELDDRFTDRDRLARMDPDQVVDAAREAIDRLRPTEADRQTLRRIEQRFLHVQPAFDGALTLYGELDPEAGATVLSALDAAAGPPTPDRDVTTNAAEGPREDDLDDGDPRPRTRARQRADALTQLAEAFLAGRRADGTVKRPRPSVLVWADIATLVGEDEAGRAARLLWNLHGGPIALTPAAARRLAEDATWRFVLHDDGEVLGVSEPTDVIPVKVRAAVAARDQGCRFPGCTAPMAWCDLHHVRARTEHGPTTVDNLVAVCRRHHTAITEGRWHLAMSRDGTVSVRRGRVTATSDPPHRRRLRPPPRPDG